MNITKREKNIRLGTYGCGVTMIQAEFKGDLAEILKCSEFWDSFDRKKEFGKDHLGLLFNMSKLTETDFMSYNQKELVDSFKQWIFADTDDCDEDIKQTFEEVYIAFKEEIVINTKYFMLNREWFDFESEQINECEYMGYDIYVLVVWFYNSSVYVCEIASD